jgi:hypothetical protein
MIVSSSTIYKWVQMFAQRKESEAFSQAMWIFGLEIMQTLEKSPTVVVEVPYKISPLASDDEAAEWLKQVRINVPEEGKNGSAALGSSVHPPAQGEAWD